MKKIKKEKSINYVLQDEELASKYIKCLICGMILLFVLNVIFLKETTTLSIKEDGIITLNPLAFWIIELIVFIVMWEMIYIFVLLTKYAHFDGYGSSKWLGLLLTFLLSVFNAFFAGLRKEHLAEIISLAKGFLIGAAAVAAIIFSIWAFCLMNKKIAIKIRGRK